jgi:hypothetical protein
MVDTLLFFSGPGYGLPKPTHRRVIQFPMQCKLRSSSALCACLALRCALLRDETLHNNEVRDRIKDTIEKVDDGLDRVEMTAWDVGCEFLCARDEMKSGRDALLLAG